MKRTLLLTFALFIGAITAGAQTFYDALTFGENTYVGSARSMGMGNAVTALGGDLGTIGINPAGSAVAGYSQTTISPSVTISSVNSKFSGDVTSNSSRKEDLVRYFVPNFGASFRFTTGASSALKSFTIGLVANSTNDYTSSAKASCTNSKSSKFAEFATGAQKLMSEGATLDYLDGDAAYDRYYKYWDVITGYRSGLVNHFGAKTDPTFLGACETLDGTNHYIPGELKQTSSVIKQGSKMDIIVNFGMNFNDRIYVGMNIGFPRATFTQKEVYYEEPIQPNLFPAYFDDGKGGAVATEYQGGRYQYSYTVSAMGIYAKLGVLALVGDNLRLGAAVQTPSSFNFTESWRNCAQSYFSKADYDVYAESPTGSNRYSMRSAAEANLGATYVFGKRALVSLDYEFTDYSFSRFGERDGDSWSVNPYEDLNDELKKRAGVSRTLRLGTEININDYLSFRCGYNRISCPEKDDDGKYYKDKTKSWTWGLGYSSKGAFFVDLAFKRTSYPSYTYYPFYDYGSPLGAEIKAPGVNSTRKLNNVVLTFGWRL